MKRYVTAREMPFVKVGTPIELMGDDYWKVTLDDADGGYVWNHKEIKKMVKEGWVIEEMSDEEFVKNAERFMGGKPPPPPAMDTKEIEELKFYTCNDSDVINKVNEIIDWIKAENARRREGK